MVVFDDQSAHNKLLATQLEQVCQEIRFDARIALVTTRIEDVLAFAQTTQQRTVFFLDIELGEVQNGIDVCRQIRESAPDAYIVFVSAYQHYAFDCLKSHAFDFLLKPFTRSELQDCMTALLRNSNAKVARSPLRVDIGSRTMIIDCEDITHFTIKGNQVTAHSAQGPLIWRESLACLLRRLDQTSFLQIRRDCIVNINQIAKIEWPDDLLVTISGDRLAISRRMRKQLHDVIAAKDQVNAHAL